MLSLIRIVAAHHRPYSPQSVISVSMNHRALCFTLSLIVVLVQLSSVTPTDPGTYLITIDHTHLSYLYVYVMYVICNLYTFQRDV